MSATMTIELKALHFCANHGWHDEEALIGNEFEVTVLATFSAREHIVTIDDTVDYTMIYELVKKIFSQREKLLETVAQNIATAVKTHFPTIRHLQITITKLTPPIVSFIGTVGITYTKKY
jgi:dihydroneopterin aldolase